MYSLSFPVVSIAQSARSRAFGSVAEPRFRANRKSLTCSAKSPDSPDAGNSEVESLFAKELAKRGLSSIDEADSSTSTSDSPASSTSGSASPTSSPPPAFAQRERTASGGIPNPDIPQLDKSRALNSEGLEGLIPRASLLVRVGGTFFLGFLPLILVASLLFVGLYYGFGDQFVHQGAATSSLPKYIDPYELLNEPTVDPYYPIN